MQASNRIIFTGFYENFVGAYALAVVVVLPSYEEYLLRVIQKALAWKVPIVASRSGGIPELIDYEPAGLLIEPNDDSTALAAAIEWLLGDRVLTERLAASGHDRLPSEFHIAVVSDRLEDVYGTVV